MGHNPNTVLMGSVQSSHKEVTNKVGAIAAGVVVRLKNDDTIVTTSADGSLLGVSLGKDLSDTNKTAICRKGLRVPLRLTGSFSPTIGAAVSISDTTGLGIAAGGGATVVNAVYATGKLSGGGVAEDGTSVDVALIDFPGGL
jgi:hypothetical protein